MKQVWFFIIYILSPFVSFAQNDSTEIVYYKSFGGLSFQQSGQALGDIEMLHIFNRLNPEAFTVMKKARRNRIISQVLISSGTLVVGWQVVESVMGTNADWRIMASGGALMLIGIPFNYLYKSFAMDAVDIFNLSIELPQSSASIRLGLTEFGPGIQLKF